MNRNSKWQTQNPSKSLQIPPFEVKRQQYTAGKVIQGFYIFSDIQCIAIDEANGKSNTFIYHKRTINPLQPNHAP